MGDKFNIGDIIRIESAAHFYAGQRGIITHVGTNGGARLEIKVLDGSITYVRDDEATVLPKPEVGDLVRVLHSGRWQAQEGNITKTLTNGKLFVDLEHEWNVPEFDPLFLEVIEKVKPLPVRIEGKPIKPEDIKRGDKISVVLTVDGEIKTTTITEAVVDKIVKKGFYGADFEFQTRTGKKIHSTYSDSVSVINLVSDIDKDVDFHALSLIKPNEIIGFPDEEGGLEVNIAVKKEYADSWTILLGEKTAKNATTVGLVNILKKKNVTFSIIRPIPSEPEFPFAKGQNVKVQRGYSRGIFDGGDYRVIIPGKEKSTIKSRGISAATYEVPNDVLIKD